MAMRDVSVRPDVNNSTYRPERLGSVGARWPLGTGDWDWSLGAGPAKAGHYGLQGNALAATFRDRTPRELQKLSRDYSLGGSWPPASNPEPPGVSRRRSR